MKLLLQTERLIIRDYQKEDSEEALGFLGNKEAMYYLPEEVMTYEEVASFIKKQETKKEYYAVVLKETNQVIGHLYFTAFFGDHSYEIGWVFNPKFHKKGYASESAEALMDYGFKELGIHRIIATCQPENIGSNKMMGQLGMRLEGEFKQCIPVNNGWWDENYYAILVSEWTQKKA
ncbi:GNAT family N-acetyltransferase [Vagococcus intermedius]|uniref:GNAT family N-acetyltransferase n=1 Tax=Vagococcus intermedius TaxID=2991418 RepID=A0AAF0I8L4_9ENTE|nr:GNAT family protein [Vagococcus intermedius]WEG72662.1 GNAT family N-acetyltransferase [Vagococcus intermedius]WEG74747.1 GNAT family N-acetyltransferase [Vagococcus intermedius]